MLVVVYISHHVTRVWRHLSLPSPGFPLPIIGHVHLLMSRESKEDPVNFLWNLWKKHQRNGLMYLKSFNLNLVFVGDYDTVKFLYNHPDAQLRTAGGLVNDVMHATRASLPSHLSCSQELFQ